jgi:hypothetical protein
MSFESSNDMGEACGMYDKKRNAYRVLVGKQKERNYLEVLGLQGDCAVESSPIHFKLRGAKEFLTQRK